MKTILIILLAGLGFESLFILNPNYIDLPFIGGVCVAFLAIGLIIGSIFKQLKAKKKLRAVRLINKSLLQSNSDLTALANRKIAVNENLNAAITKLKSENYDLMKKCETFVSVSGNLKQLQNKYAEKTEAFNELKKSFDKHVEYGLSLTKENKHLKDENTKLQNMVQSSLENFDNVTKLIKTK